MYLSPFTHLIDRTESGPYYIFSASEIKDSCKKRGRTWAVFSLSTLILPYQNKKSSLQFHQTISLTHNSVYIQQHLKMLLFLLHPDPFTSPACIIKSPFTARSTGGSLPQKTRVELQFMPFELQNNTVTTLLLDSSIVFCVRHGFLTSEIQSPLISLPPPPHIIIKMSGWLKNKETSLLL